MKASLSRCNTFAWSLSGSDHARGVPQVCSVYISRLFHISWSRKKGKLKLVLTIAASDDTASDARASSFAFRETPANPASAAAISSHQAPPSPRTVANEVAKFLSMY